MAEEQANTSPEMAARLEYLGSLDYQRFDLEEELENKINLLETEYKAKYGAFQASMRLGKGTKMLGGNMQKKGGVFAGRGSLCRRHRWTSGGASSEVAGARARSRHRTRALPCHAAVLDKELRDIVSGKLDVVDGQTVEPTSQEGERGIPGFWAKALQTNPDIQEMVCGCAGEWGRCWARSGGESAGWEAAGEWVVSQCNEPLRGGGSGDDLVQ